VGGFYESVNISSDSIILAQLFKGYFYKLRLKRSFIDVTHKLKFHVFRFVGILALGIAALELAMIARYWTEVELDLIRNFVILLLIASLFLSIEQNK